ncbi:hypothetical protein C0992_003332 [Termitomyces sp. T32_za158]|nr:hypothetical protein C0992_003332 [Termitomyces sp. T32_za158]
MQVYPKQQDMLPLNSIVAICHPMIKEIHTDEVIHCGVKEFAQNALMNLALAHDAIIEAHIFQMHYTNNCQGEEPAIDKGALAYLFTKNLNLPKGRASKLCLKWVGSHKVLEAELSTSNYVLELPTALQAQRIMLKFHVLLLQPYVASNDAPFLNRATPELYDFGMAEDQEWFVDDLMGHCWTQSGNLEFKVRWSLENIM